MSRPRRPGTTAALLLGLAAAFVVGTRLLAAIGPALLLDPEPAWLPARYLLWIGLLSSTAAGGALVAALGFLWFASRAAPERPEGLPFSRAALLAIGLAAFAAGAAFRFAWLETIPLPLWLDDVSLIQPTLALEQSWRDFGNAIRAAPYGVDEPFGSVGVLYLQIYRLCLELGGITVLGVRLPSALAGVASTGTAMLLGRALLPRGGGALAGLALAGMRWNLILSRWGWNAIVLAPILDVAALLVLAARRRRSIPLATVAGLVAGLSTHIYLASWVGSAALLLLAAWPNPREDSRPEVGEIARPPAGGWRPALPMAFAVAAALAAAPLFLLREERTSPYFARANDHNVVLEMKRARSPLPLVLVAADALAAPWFLSDPTPRHDLPGRSRLGIVLGALVAVAFASALLAPRRDFSAFLLAHALAAFAATVAGGRATAPNGYRFGYLSNVAAVAAAGGALVVLRAVRPESRRAAALALTGLVATASVAGARDALLSWGGSRSTFDAFFGQDTLLARAASRWDSYGELGIDTHLGHHRLTIAGARRYRLDPDRRNKEHGTRNTRKREFRIIEPREPPPEGERLVERVTDDWGREWARVYGKRAAPVPDS